MREFSLLPVNSVPLSEKDIETIGDEKLKKMEKITKESQRDEGRLALFYGLITSAVAFAFISSKETCSDENANSFVVGLIVLGGTACATVHIIKEYLASKAMVTKVQQARAIVMDDMDLVASKEGKKALVKAGYFVEQTDSKGTTYTRAETQKPN